MAIDICHGKKYEVGIPMSDLPRNGAREGNERRAIYRDEDYYAHFLACMETCAQAFRMRLYLFCLMPNHFSFVGGNTTRQFWFLHAFPLTFKDGSNSAATMAGDQLTRAG